MIEGKLEESSPAATGVNLRYTLVHGAAIGVLPVLQGSAILFKLLWIVLKIRSVPDHYSEQPHDRFEHDALQFGKSLCSLYHRGEGFWGVRVCVPYLTP